MRMTTFRVLLALATLHGFDIDQIDVNTAFLYGELDETEELYVKLPPGKMNKSENGRPEKI